MSLLKRRNNSDYIFIILGCLITAYLLLRTYFVDITDDEAWSYYNVKKFWYVEALCCGNTHWFNFAAIKIALLLGFEKAWQLRWFSVLSGITFIYIGYKWIRTLEGMPIKLFAFSFIFLNPYLLEYLTLARGYSGGLCFLAFSLLFFTRALQENEKRPLALLSLVFAGLSAISNYSFFYFFTAFCIIYFYHFYFKNGAAFLKMKRFYIDLLFSAGICAFVLRALLFIVECSNDIETFGGTILISSVFFNFIDTLFYRNFNLPDVIRNGLGLTLFLFVLFSSLFGIIKRKKYSDPLYLYSSAILLIMLALTVFNKLVLNILYPTERAALLFYPLMALVLTGFLRNVLGIGSVFKKVVLYLISLILIINFCLSFNLRSGYDHPGCKYSGSYFEYLNTLGGKKIGIQSELYLVFIKYYQIRNCQFQAEAINTIGHANHFIKENKLEDFEYLLLLYPYNLSYYKNSKVKFTTDKFFPETKALIVKVTK
jgi:hypothetical protein